MKLAASQIAWSPEEEPQALALLRERGFTGLEAAPTRVTGPDPYGRLGEAARYAETVRAEYGLEICSLQSIFFGQTGSIFGGEREFLLEYAKGAARFAGAVGAGNIVFGCPKNRSLPEGETDERAVAFFREVGDFAAQNGAVLALEANPPVYNTNYMNTTPEALDVARRVGSAGCRVNLDVGTMLTNGESPDMLRGRVGEIHHVHVSEPALAPIQPRALHGALAALLREEHYGGYVSIEMKAHGLDALEKAAAYVAEVFS